MNEFIANVLENVVKDCGIGKFMPKSLKDNITIVKPRVEYEFLTHTIKRTGRKLAIRKIEETRHTKKELYTVDLQIRLFFFGDSKESRSSFIHDFFYHLPKGINDNAGNYIKFAYQNHVVNDEGDKRIGDSVIEVLKSFNASFDLLATYRITEEYAENFVTNVTITQNLT